MKKFTEFLKDLNINEGKTDFNITDLKPFEDGWKHINQDNKRKNKRCFNCGYYQEIPNFDIGECLYFEINDDWAYHQVEKYWNCKFFKKK